MRQVKFVMAFLCLACIWMAFIFADTWQDTTTADFNAAGSVTDNTQVINDSVQMSVTPGASWWEPAANWWNPNSSPAWWDTNYQYRKAITIDNKNASALSDYQIKVENPAYNEAGLVGSWHFNGGTSGAIANGTTAGLQDTSGNSNNGNSSNANGTGMAWTTGKADGAVIFDGVDDKVSVGDQASLKGFNVVTAMAWIKVNAQQTGGVLANTSGGYNFYYNSASGIRAEIVVTGGIGIAFYGGILPISVWKHIAMTYDQQNLRLYIDGIQVNAVAEIRALLAQDAAGFRIGEYAGYFNGAIDEVRIYNRALSPAEIKAHYDAKARPDYSDIRFVNSAGTAEFPYWMEKDGTFWVNVAGVNSIPAGFSTISMYYGNASAVSTSNGNGTFLAFADYADFSTQFTSDSASIEGNEIKISSTAGWATGWIKANENLDRTNANYELVFNMRSTGISPNDDETYGGFGTSNMMSSPYTDSASFVMGSANLAIYHYTSLVYNSAAGYTYTNMNEFKIKINSTDRFYYLNNALLYTNSDTTAVAKTGITLYGNGPIYFKNIRLRKYASAEPAVYIGSEISQTSAWQYRKAITIDNKNAAALSDYQVKIENPVYNETGLAGSWHFEDNTGTVAEDSSGQTNNGTWSGSGAHWTADGKFGNAGQFNGSNDYVNTNNYINKFDGNFTIGLWARTSSAAMTSIFNKGFDVAGWGPYILMRSQSTATTSQFYLLSNSPSNSSAAVNGISINDGNWHYLTGVRNGASMLFYIDGALQGSTAINAAENYNSNYNVLIGAKNGNGTIGEYFNGSIDEVRIYSRALSVEEIASHYNARAKLNYGDIRFTGNSGAEFPYWMEKDGTFWVKVLGQNSIAASGDSLIYAYYGNMSATYDNYTGGVQAFEFFDDFSKDLSKWTNNLPAKISIANGELKEDTSLGTGWQLNDIYTKQTFTPQNSVLEYKTRIEGSQTDAWTIGWRGDGTANNTYYISFNPYVASSEISIGATVAGVSTSGASAGTAHTMSAYYNFKAYINGNTFNVSSDLTSLSETDTKYTQITSANIGISEWSDTLSAYYDNVRIRKYAATEPVITIGSEIAPTSQWLYRKPVTITNSGAALSDYQVKIEGLSYDETGLAGSWHFEEAGGTTVADTSGNDNNAVLTNDPAWSTTGRFGNALSFDGTNDYVEVPNSTSLDITGPITLEAWIYKNGQPAADPRGIVGKWWNYGASLVKRSFDLNELSTSYPRFSISSDGTAGAGSYAYATGTTLLQLNTWYHIVGVYAPSSSISIYVNGVPENTNTTNIPSVIYSSTEPVRIGATYDPAAASRIFNGLIDEVRIYNRALSEMEIQARYNAKTKLNYNDIRFTGNSGTEFPYWMEKDGMFWVKVSGTNSIAASADTPISMYFGNSNASAISNGSAVFDFFDDFNRADGTMGNEWTQGGGTATIYGEKAKIRTNAVNDGYANHIGQNNNITIETDFYVIPDDPTYRGVGVMVRDTGSTSYAYGYGWYLTQHTNTLYINDNGTNKSLQSLTVPVSTWYKSETKINSADSMEIRIWQKGTTRPPAPTATWSSTASTGNYHKIIGAGSYNTDHGYYDNWFVRKYASAEPVTSAGTEETPYSQTGTFISAVRDISADNSVIDSVSWTATGSGTLTLQVRASNLDTAGWTGNSPVWEDVTNGDTSVASTGKHIQYKAIFSGTGQSSEPVLTDVTIIYTVPIIPPIDSVSCEKLTNTWYSTATFIFSNTIGFGPQIDKYYYAWDNTASYTFTLGEPVWNSSTPQLQNSSTSDGLWYFHYKPYSSTNTAGTAQDMGPFKYDGTAPPAVTLSLPLNNASISESTTGFTWSTVTDLSGVTHTFQLDNYTSFSSPVINKTGLTDPAYTLTGAGAEVLIGNSTYYWRVIATDGAGNMSYTTNPSYYKFTTASTIPQMINESTGEMYASVQDAIDSASTIDGDTISIEDTIAHTENIILTKNVTLENGILSPASGFAVTGQGATGGEILRNCVITSGGISGLALGENLTIFNPNPTEALVIENSHLVNCLIEYETEITNSILENCDLTATESYFIDAANNDFHLTENAATAIDQGKNLSTEFTGDMEDILRGKDILDITNFDTGAWDIGAYEFDPQNVYINQQTATDTEGVTDNTENGTNSGSDTGTDAAAETPIIALSLSAIVFTSETGTLANPVQQLLIHSSNNTDFDWIIAKNVDWITINPASGSTAQISEVGITADISELAKGTYNGILTISSDTASNSPITMPITLYLTEKTDGSVQNILSAPDEPLLLSPANGAISLAAPPLLEWENIGSSYWMQIAEDQDFSMLFVNKVTEKFRYQTFGVEMDTIYYWRVKAVNSAGMSKWSNTFWFKLQTESDDDETPKACFIKKMH